MAVVALPNLLGVLFNTGKSFKDFLFVGLSFTILRHFNLIMGGGGIGTEPKMTRFL